MSLKKFEILELIAKGGMAEVYLAKTTGFQGFEKQVCVKKILPHLTEDDSFVTMFVNEAKLAATLNYANIVQVHDLCVSAGGEYFIVMEYVNGKDLSDVIRAAQLAGREIPADIAAYIAREVCRGLDYAHGQTDANGANLNIIHRDISPHNVLISHRGEVKLTDFGIAKASSIANKTAVGILKGKYGYMSPEQARGQPLDHRSDIFNTGIVLYEMLVGERCFAGSSDFSTLNLMRNAEITPPSKIATALDPDLEGLVLRALSRDRDDRFQTALEFEGALGDWAKGASQTAAAAELTRFMRELFAKNEARSKGEATGVLALSSVVGPEPSAEQPNASEPPPPPPTKPPATPEIEAAPPSAKPPPMAAPPGAAASQAPSPPPPAAPATPPKPDAPARETEAPPPKKRPARLPGKSSAPPAKKKKGKQVSDGPKSPVGRKHLRPGLTQLQRAQSIGLRGWTVAASVTLVALLCGVVVGTYRGRQLSRQTTFREMEIVNREGTGPKTVTLLIRSTPPGATVRFDDRELAGTTPLAFERDRDAQTHDLVVSLEGYETSRTSLKYSEEPMTFFSTVLRGRPGRLEVSTQPSELPVYIDGEHIGDTPLFREVPQGRHVLELGGGQHAKLREEIIIRVGAKTTIARAVPSASVMAELSIDSEPRAMIILNGTPTGRETGGEPLSLPPGVDHEVTLDAAPQGRERKQIRVNLEKGETRSIFVDLTSS